MFPMRSMIKTAGYAALVAVTVGAGAIAAAPATAAEPSFSFHIGVGNGQPSFGFDVQNDAPRQQQPWRRDHRPGDNGRPNGSYSQYPNNGFNACLTDNEVIRGLRGQGYERIQVTDSDRRSADIEANYGRYHYVLDVDKCSGAVDIVQRDRIRTGYQQPRFGFGLQFDTSN